MSWAETKTIWDRIASLSENLNTINGYTRTDNEASATGTLSQKLTSIMSSYIGALSADPSDKTAGKALTPADTLSKKLNKMSIYQIGDKDAKDASVMGKLNSLISYNSNHGTYEQTKAGSYTWTCPEGVNSIYVALIGAGGGGGGGGGGVGPIKSISNSTIHLIRSGGGSSGSPGEIVTAIVGVKPGTSYSIKVGTAGSAGKGGTKDSNTTFYGTASTGGTGGNGGESSFGDLVANGGKGGSGGIGALAATYSSTADSDKRTIAAVAGAAKATSGANSLKNKQALSYTASVAGSGVSEYVEFFVNASSQISNSKGVDIVVEYPTITAITTVLLQNLQCWMTGIPGASAKKITNASNPALTCSGGAGGTGGSSSSYTSSKVTDGSAGSAGSTGYICIIY